MLSVFILAPSVIIYIFLICNNECINNVWQFIHQNYTLILYTKEVIVE